MVLARDTANYKRPLFSDGVFVAAVCLSASAVRSHLRAASPTGLFFYYCAMQISA